jgi:hypothetical protein
MELRLFKEPHTEPFTPDIARLLFEGTVEPVGSLSADCMDFYIYTWIRGMATLDSFQAVLADSVSLIYRTPRFISVGKVGRTPLNRAIQRTDSVRDKEILCSAMGNLTNEQFPQLVGAISRIALGEELDEVRLTDSESCYLEQISRKAN